MFKIFIVFGIISLFQTECLCHGERQKFGNNNQSSGKKVLVILPPFFMASHYLQIAMLSSGLSARGHQIHLLGNALMKTNPIVADYNGTHAFWYELGNPDGMVQQVQVAMDDVSKNGAGLAGFSLFDRLNKVMSKDCRDLFSHTKLLQKLKAEKYDLLVVNLFFPCEALVARFLNISFVAVTTSREYPYLCTRVFGFPSELSYVPELFVGLSDKMTFKERVENVVLRFLQRFIFPRLLLADYREIQREQGIDVNSDILDIMGKASLWISYSDLSLDFPQPTMPNFVRSGGMAVKKASPLQQDLDDFVQGSGENGVIVFSLGSMAGSLPDDRITEMIASAFSKLPQRIIWRHTGEQPKKLGNNTKILKWMPQNDLLGHPKTRLFVGHGGLNGVYEALYNAVPMILIPLMAPDQPDTAARVVSKGMGLQLDWRTITEESFYDAVTEVLNNNRYRESVSLHSAIHRDLQPAQDRAVFWIEHVLKFGDGHLRAQVFELNLIQYYLIDVATFFIVIAVAGFLLLRFTCRLCCKVCKGSDKTKTE